MLKILFLADIVGRIGREAVKQYLLALKKQFQPDFVIANAENLAHGIGFTQKTLAEIKEAGVDFFTSGNHAWEKAGSNEILNQADPIIIRPANCPKKRAGQGVKTFLIGQNKLSVVNLLGKVFIKGRLYCPFKTLEKIIKDCKDSVIIVDFHAEATSEKNALAQYFDGKVAAIIGTHTHVPTADERILEKGTAYLTDAGMIGYYDSVIGANKEQILNMFLGTGKTSKKHDLPNVGACQFNAIYLEIDVKTKKALKIKRLNKIIKIK